MDFKRKKLATLAAAASKQRMCATDGKNSIWEITKKNNMVRQVGKGWLMWLRKENSTLMENYFQSSFNGNEKHIIWVQMAVFFYKEGLKI